MTYEQWLEYLEIPQGGGRQEGVHAGVVGRRLWSWA